MRTITLIETAEDLIQLSRPGQPLNGLIDFHTSSEVRLTQSEATKNYRLVNMSYTVFARACVEYLCLPPLQPSDFAAKPTA